MIKSFDPIFNKNCKILILGSCPSVKSLEQGEYYAHKQNRFWKVMFALFKEKPTNDYSAKKQMLLNNGIGLWDALVEQKQNPLTIDDVTKMVAGQIGQLAPMDEEATDLFQQLAKKLIEQTGK